MAIQRRYRLQGLQPAAAGWIRSNPALLPALMAVAVFLVLAGSDGGFYPTAWYAAGLFLLGTLGATILGLGWPRALPRPAAAALALLVAYAGWTYLSIVWASQPGPAWDGANRAAMFVAVYALFALWPFDARGAITVLAVLGLGIAAIGLVELLRANASADPGAYFVDVRFSEPTGYMNANVALWSIGLLPCLFIASRRELPAALRGPALGGAGLLAGLALLGQSRGWVLAMPLALAFFLAVCPGRVRLLAAIGAVAIAAAAVSGPVLSVHDDFSREQFDALLSSAASAILIAAAMLTLAGLVAAVLDRRTEVEPATGRRIGVAVGLLAAVAVLAGAVVYTVAEGSPTERIADSWSDFKGGGDAPQAGASRFAGGGTNRYDFWKVAWHTFRDEPVRGIGVENYQEEYLRRGSSDEQPLYAHSLELGALSQTGIVGALLLFGGLIAALVAAAGSRAAPPLARAAAAAATALFAYWLLHGSVDWFWEFPALAAPALAALGLAGALAPRRTPPAPGPRIRARRRAAGIAAGAALVALALSFTAPWLAAREVDRAESNWAGNADGALRRLDRAEQLNPLSARPPLTAATIALRVHRVALAKREFRDALEREPRNFYALLELGAIASGEGDSATALRLVRRAHELTPRDPDVARALRKLESGRHLDVQSLNRSILRRALRRGSGID